MDDLTAQARTKMLDDRIALLLHNRAVVMHHMAQAAKHHASNDVVLALRGLIALDKLALDYPGPHDPDEIEELADRLESDFGDITARLRSHAENLRQPN